MPKVRKPQKSPLAKKRAKNAKIRMANFKIDWAEDKRLGKLDDSDWRGY